MCAAYVEWSVWVIAASPVMAAAIVLAVDRWA
jgi:hypothetical protein